MLIYQKKNTEVAPDESKKLNILINSTIPAAEAGNQVADVVLTKLVATSSGTVEGIVASFGSIQNELSITGSTATTDGNNLVISGQAELTGGASAAISASLILPIINDARTNKIVCRDDDGQINLPVQAGSELVQEPGLHQSVSRVWVAGKLQEEVTNVYDGTVPGTIKAIKDGNARDIQVYGWSDKIGSLTAGTFIEITGSGDSRTIAVTGLGTAATYSSDAFATSAQGAKADTAIQSIAEATTNGKIKFTKDGTTYTEVVVHGLGTAAYQNTDYFLAAGATAADALKLGGETPGYYAAKSEIPSTYIQSASVNGNTLTLTNQAGTVTTFTDTTYSAATTTTEGLMSAADKTKLDSSIILQNNNYCLTDGTRSVTIADVITHITTCFRGDTSYVTMYDGTTRLISEVKAGDSVLGYDVNKQEYCEAIVLDNIKTGESNEFDCYVFEDGTTVDIYGNDSFLTHHMSNFDNPEAKNSDCFSACLIDYLYSRSREHKDYLRKVIKNTGGKDNGVAVVYKRTFKCAASTGRYCIDTSNGTCFINGLCAARKPVNMITRLTQYYETFGSKIDNIFADIIARHSGGIDDLIPDDHIEDVTSAELFKEWNSNKASITLKKEFLNNTDYKAMKYAEGVLSEEEWLPIREQRIAARAEINCMEERNAELIPLLKETNPYFMHEYGDKYAWVYRNRKEMLDFADLNNMLEDVREYFARKEK